MYADSSHRCQLYCMISTLYKIIFNCYFCTAWTALKPWAVAFGKTQKTEPGFPYPKPEPHQAGPTLSHALSQTHCQQIVKPKKSVNCPSPPLPTALPRPPQPNSLLVAGDLPFLFAETIGKKKKGPFGSHVLWLRSREEE